MFFRYIKRTLLNKRYDLWLAQSKFNDANGERHHSALRKRYINGIDYMGDGNYSAIFRIKFKSIYHDKAALTKQIKLKNN